MDSIIPQFMITDPFFKKCVKAFGPKDESAVRDLNPILDELTNQMACK